MPTKENNLEKLIGNFQMIQKMIAEMATETEMMRTFLYDSCKLWDEGKVSIHKSMQWLNFNFLRWQQRLLLMLIQLHGGYGYSREFPLERMMRDNKLNEIGAGTNEVMIMIIAKNLLREAQQ
jgi:isovaleryl-CoA dehydrogenase